MEVTILQTLADQLTNAITNARLYNQAQTALKEVEAIYRRYMAQEWTKYVRTRPTSGFIQSQGGISPLGNELLPGVQQAMEKLQPIVDIEQEQPVLVVPVKLRDQPIGAIGLKAEASGRHWSDDDITLIETLSEQLALAAENIRLLDETQRRAEREHIVSEITTRLRATNNPQTILQTAAGELRRALNAKNARILIQSPKQSPEQPLEQDNKEYDPVSALDETLASIKKVIPSEGKHDIHNRGGK
jgi:GAF domain-containing protein